MIKFFKTGSVLYHYLFSYLSIALLSCALIGVFSANMFLKNVEHADRLANQHKMELVVKYIENQLKILERVSFKISSDIKYQPLQLQLNKYNEKELLDDFRKYIGYSPLSSEYFLLYNDMDLLYLSSGNVSRYDIYFRDNLRFRDTENFRSQLYNVKQFTILFSEDKQNIFFAFPISGSSVRNAPKNATLCFMTNIMILQQCITDTTGGLEGKLKLNAGENILALWESREKTENRRLFACSPEGRISMTLNLPQYSIYKRIAGLRWINWATIILLVFLILSVATIFAYRNFKPIKQINAKIKRREKIPEVDNELENIDNICSAVIENNVRANKHLAEQMRMIREQTLRLLFSGNCSDNMLERLKLQGIQFENDYLSVFLLLFPDYSEDFFEKKEEALFRLIEDLSGDNVRLYAVKDRLKNCIAIVANLKDENIDEAEELILAVMESEEQIVILGNSEVYNSILNLPAAYMEAIADCEEKNTCRTMKLSNSCTDVNPLYYDSKYITRILRAVRAGNYEEAKEHLDAFTMRLWETTHSLLVQRYIYSDILVTLVKTGRELNVPISQNQINTALTAQDVYDFQNSVAAILKTLCRKMGNIEADDTEISQKVLTYIQAHCMKYDLSLEKISQEFGLSANHLCRLIKQAAGENYKDYVTQLRIEQAKKLLRAGLSVADTCEQVGYANISHFIKNFKKEIGVTPSSYKKQQFPDAG